MTEQFISGQDAGSMYKLLLIAILQDHGGSISIRSDTLSKLDTITGQGMMLTHSGEGNVTVRLLQDLTANADQERA